MAASKRHVLDPRPQDFRIGLLRGERTQIPKGGYLELLANSFERFSDEVAVIDGWERLTYRQLETESELVSELLTARFAGDVRETKRIGLCSPVSVSYLVCLLATWKAGASYFPVPVEQPSARRQRMHEVASPSFVLDEREMRELRAIAKGSAGVASVPRVEVASRHPSSEAYVLFTSGSTGRPKGVPISHEAIANRLGWMASAHGLMPGDVLLQKASVGFDVSLVELLGPLLSGATVRIFSKEGASNLDALVEALTESRTTIAVFMPVQLQQLLEHPRARELSLRRVFTGGEAFGIELVQQFYRVFPQAILFSGYGPTEATISVTAWRAEPNATRVALGSPLPNTELLVLTDSGTPALEGEVGELLVAGPCLTRGYLDEDEKNQSAFVSLPIDGHLGRFYRTGDLVRRQGDELFFVGRRDTQLKIRGVRIELEEIERVMRSAPGVADAAVAVIDGAHEFRLVGFVRTDPNESLELQKFREWLAASLPPEMIPALRVASNFPLSPSGKLDREQLKEMARTPAQSRERGLPNSALGMKLAACWRQVLEHDDFDCESHFFEVGGHSLNVVSLAGLVQRSVEFEVGLATFFEHPFLGGQIEALERLMRRPSDSVELAGAATSPRKPFARFPHFFVLHGALEEAQWSDLAEHIAAPLRAHLGTRFPDDVKLEFLDFTGEPERLERLLFDHTRNGAETTRLELLVCRVGNAFVVAVRCPHGERGVADQSAQEFAEIALRLFPDCAVAVERDPAFAERRTGAAPSSLEAVRRAVRKLASTANNLSSRSPHSRGQPRENPFHGLERFHSQCLLGTVEGYARTVFGHSDHARLLGEHSILYSSETAYPTLTHEAPDFEAQREALRHYYGISFSRSEFSDPIREIAVALETGMPVLLDFDFTHLPHRREYEGAPAYHAIVAVGLDHRRHSLLAHEQTTGLVRIPLSEVEEYFSGKLPNGKKPGRILCTFDGTSEPLRAFDVEEKLRKVDQNLTSPSSELGVRALEEAASISRSGVFWFEGCWAFSHDLDGLVRYLDAATADLGRELLSLEERARIQTLKRSWHRIDTLFENARLSSDPSLSALALREMKRLVQDERALVELLRKLRKRVAG